MQKLNPRQFSNALFIFPHPDDETLSCGGLIKSIAKHGTSNLLLLTKGERGTPTGKLNQKLKKIRTQEAVNVGEILHISNLTHHDLGDGQLKSKIPTLKKVIEKTIAELNPDLIVSYDLAGLYGHPDHIATAKAVTSVSKSFPHIPLLYVCFNQLWLKFSNLPTHMSEDANYLKDMTQPTHYHDVGLNTVSKIKALYAHKSQHHGFKKSLPPHCPLWTYSLVSWREYYHWVE